MMTIRMNLIHTVILVALTTTLFVGCSPSQSAKPAADPPNAPAAKDTDDVPISEADVDMPAGYAEALPRIKSYRDTIRSAVEVGTPTKAHRALDKLDIVLNKLPALARDSGVAKEQWETVNTTARELRELFNQVHSAIDEKRTPDYAAVAEGIDAAIDRLTNLAPREEP